MPDEPAGQNDASRAQELGADILAKLDKITRQSEASFQVTLEERKKLAREAIDKMNAIVESFIAKVNARNAEAQQLRAASDLAEIEQWKASVQ